MAAPADPAGLRLGRDVLASAARVAAPGRMEAAAPSAVGVPRRDEPDRLDAGRPRYEERAGEKRGHKVARNPTDKGKPGSKHHVVTDRQGEI